jgi:hypothetical protein
MTMGHHERQPRESCHSANAPKKAVHSRHLPILTKNRRRKRRRGRNHLDFA